MLIRNAAPADVPQIIALEQQAETAAHWSPREYDALFAPEAPLRLALVKDDPKESGKLAGFLIARCVHEEWEIENLVTATNHRRTGVASTLIRELLARARAQGTTSVLLEVRKSNVGARWLYQKLGFVEHGRRSNYYCNPDEDAVLLRFLLQKRDKSA